MVEIMNDVPEPNDNNDIRVTIEMVNNGVIVRGCKSNSDGPNREEEYVYKSLDEALKEIPSLVSVLQEKSKKPTTKQEKVNGVKVD